MSMSFEDMDATLKGGGVQAVSAPQLFPTPAGLAARMVEAAALVVDHGRARYSTVLEPSAGTGSLLATIPIQCDVTAVEISYPLQNALMSIRSGLHVHCGDFLKCSPAQLGTFDVVLANPPFTKGQDMRHIRHMWQFVRPGGRLVTLSSMSWTFGQRKECQAFRDWLDEIDATQEQIERGTFTGTDVATVLIRATK